MSAVTKVTANKLYQSRQLRTLRARRDGFRATVTETASEAEQEHQNCRRGTKSDKAEAADSGGWKHHRAVYTTDRIFTKFVGAEWACDVK